MQADEIVDSLGCLGYALLIDTCLTRQRSDDDLHNPVAAIQLPKSDDRGYPGSPTTGSSMR